MIEAEGTGGKQFLTVTLNETVFALPVESVREVLDLSVVTRVPRTPDYLCGVINLRGSVVPVVDLRMVLGMSRTERTRNTCIVILDPVVEKERTLLGALADSVQEVIELSPSQVQAPPRMGTVGADLVSGMGKRDNEFVIILDPARILTADTAGSSNGALQEQQVVA